jgi:branched-subunit amino acid ABC-type transport system permease component
VSLALSLLLAPLALDGESVNNNNTAIAAVSLVSIVGGFLLLGALWYFVFRTKAWDKDKDDPPPRG